MGVLAALIPFAPCIFQNLSYSHDCFEVNLALASVRPYRPFRGVLRTPLKQLNRARSAPIGNLQFPIFLTHAIGPGLH